MRTSGVKKALEVANGKLGQSSQQKKLIVRFWYNEYIVQHYAVINDLVISRESPIETHLIKKVRSEKFEMKALHDLHYFLGMEILQTSNKFTL